MPTKIVWIEQLLLTRLRRVRDTRQIDSVFDDLLRIKIDRYHTELRVEAMKTANKLRVRNREKTEEVLDHLEKQRTIALRRNRQLLRLVMEYAGQNADRSGLSAVLDAVGNSPRRKREPKGNSK